MRRLAILGLAVVAGGAVWGAAELARRGEVHAWRARRATLEAAARRYPDATPERAGAGGLARAARFQDPMGLAMDARGRIYLADRGHFVWRIDRDGRARLLAGTGRLGEPQPGRAALESELGTPQGLALDAEGGVVFADSLFHVILRIAPDGRLERVAGTGERGFSGDGGSALDARLDRPYDVAFGADGVLFIADRGNHRIRAVGPDGRIATWAGSGRPGYGGDGGPAREAQLQRPYAVLVDSAGRLLIADSGNHVVRRVGLDGRIETVAGSGQRGFAGDGGPAHLGRFDSPQCLAESAGRLFVCDEHNHAVRAVEPDGTLSTWVGTGSPGRATQGAPADGSALHDPEALLVLSAGDLLISDGDNRRVLRLVAGGTLTVFAGSGEAP